MGLAAYTLDGDKLWHVLDGVAGLVGSDGGRIRVRRRRGAYPQTVRVIDLADGSVRTVRGQLPMFVTSLSIRSVADGVQPPFARNALQLANAEVGELDAGARDQVLHGAGDGDGPHLRFTGHSRADADGDPRELAVVQLALAGVQPRADLRALAPGRPMTIA